MNFNREALRILDAMDDKADFAENLLKF